MTNKGTVIKIGLIVILSMFIYSRYTIFSLKKEIQNKTNELFLYEDLNKSVNKTLKEIKKENDSLNCFIEKIKDLKPNKITEIKTVTKIIIDSSMVEKSKSDSVYIFTDKTNLYNYKLSINANSLTNYKLDIDVYDIIRVVDNGNSTFVETTNSSITENITYRKNKNKVSNFKFNLGVGVGYGVIHKKPDIFIGVGFGYNF